MLILSSSGTLVFIIFIRAVPIGATRLRGRRLCGDKLISVKAELSFQEMENENGLKEKSCLILPQKLEFYKR